MIFGLSRDGRLYIFFDDFRGSEEMYVMCLRCHKKFEEEKVEFLGISEDEFGRDRMQFRCPACRTEQESFRIS